MSETPPRLRTPSTMFWPGSRGLPDASNVLVEEPALATRVRRPVDIVFLLVSALGLTLLAGLSIAARDTLSGVHADFQGLQTWVPSFVLVPLAIAVSLMLIAVRVLIIWRPIAQRDLRSVGQLLAADITATILAGQLSHSLTEQWMVDGIREALSPGAFSIVQPVPGFIAGTVALIGSSGQFTRPWVRQLGALGVLGAALESIAKGETTPTGVAAAGLIGMFVAFAYRLSFGVPTDRPSGYRIASVMVAHGIPLVRLRAVEGEWPRMYTGWLAEPDTPTATSDTDEVAAVASAPAPTPAPPGRAVDVIVLDRDREGDGALSTLWRWIRTRDEFLPRERLTMRSGTDRRVLESRNLAAIGVRTPPVVLAAAIGSDAIMIAYEHVDAHPLDGAPTEVSDESLHDLWIQIDAMYRASVSHRQLSDELVRIDDDGRVWILSYGGGSIAATEIARDADLAEALITATLAVGDERAVRTAVATIGADRLARAIPMLQPLILPKSSRAKLRERENLLEDLRERVATVTGTREIIDVRVERVRLRTIFTSASLLFAGYIVLSQISGGDLIGTVQAANPWLLAACALFSVATYVGTTLALVAFVTEPGLFKRLLDTQVALSYVRLFAPGALGNTAVSLRVLMRSGIPAPAGATAVAAWQASAVFVGTPALFIAVALSGQESAITFSVSPSAVAGGLVAVLALASTAAFPKIRLRYAAAWHSFLDRGLPRLLDAIQNPGRLALSLVGQAMVTFGYALALWTALASVGAHVSFAIATLVSLTASTVSGIVPTPGGIGAAEAALVAGLAAVGVPSAEAVPATLVYRLFTFWVPLLPGWWYFHRLTKQGMM